MAEFNRLFEGVFRGHGRNMRAGRQLPAQFEAAGLGAPDRTHAAAHFLPLAAMADMLIGVYDGLFAAGAEFGIADPVRAAAFRAEMKEAGGRRPLLVPAADPDQRLEADRVKNATSSVRQSPPLLLVGHRLAPYITAEPRRYESAGAPILSRGPAPRSLRRAGRVSAPGADLGPGRSARRRGSAWRK